MIERPLYPWCAPRAARGIVLILAVLALGFGELRGQGPLNLVYVVSNIGSVSGMNSVFAFNNDGRGNLTPVAGSPFLTGGTGVYDPGGLSTAFDADGQVIIRPDGTLLLAVNSHSNTIAVFTINSDGSLSAVAGSPFASGGQDPVSLALAYQAVNADTDILTVVNKAQDPAQTGGTPNYSTFFFSSAGTMTSTGQSIQFRAGSSPSQVLFNASSGTIFANEFEDAVIVSYRLNKTTGALSELSSAPAPGGNNFLGMVLHPTLPFLYAAQPSVSQLNAYKFVKSTGVMTLTSTLSDPGLTPCWLAMNASGSRLYVSETASNSISVYQTAPAPNAPVLLQTLTLQGPAGNAVNLALDPTGRFLYVVHNQDLDQKRPAKDNGTDLHVLSVSANGTLTQVKAPTPLPVPNGETPVGIAVLMK